MAFQNSTLTLEDVKNHFIRRRKDDEITDSDVVDAVNDFYSIMQRLEMEMFPDRFRKISSAVSITSTGYDLSGITDLGSDHRGFEVYKTNVSASNKLERMHPASSHDGYYIIDNKLFMTNLPGTGTQSVIILYMTKTTKLALTVDLTTTTLAIDQDLEKALREFVRSVFYDGQYLVGLRQEAEEKTIEELSRYFATSSNTIFIN